MPKITRIQVTGEQLRDFVRGEITIWELTEAGEDPETTVLTGGDGYKITMDDFSYGIRNYMGLIKRGMESIDEMYDEWILPLLYYIGDLIRFPTLIGFPDKKAEQIPIELSMFIGPFFQNEAELAYYAYAELYELDDIRPEIREDLGILERALQDLLDVIANYPENKGKPKAEWKLTYHQKYLFVFRYDGEELKEADAPLDIEQYKKAELAE